MMRAFLRTGMRQKTGTAEFHKELYSKEVIAKAVNDYSEIADIFVKNKEKYWQCLFQNCRFETEQTIREFENYMIDLLNVRG